MDWQEGGDRGSLGRSSTLVSRKVRRHKGRWGRQAKQTVQLLDGFGVTSTGKVTADPSLQVTDLSLANRLCAQALLGPWGLGWSPQT